MRLDLVWRARRFKAAALFSLLIVPACDFGGTPAPEPTETESAIGREWSGTNDRSAGVPGVVYFQSGEDPFKQDLFLLEFDPLRITQLTAGARVSTMDACEREVIVASPDPLGDALHRLRNGELELLPGLGRKHAQVPSLSKRCEIAFTQPVNEPSDTPARLWTWDARSEKGQVLLEGPRDVGSPGWGSGGELLVLQKDRGTTSLVEVGSMAGEALVLPGWVTRFRPVANEAGWIAVGGQKGGPATFLVGPDGQTETIRGWSPLDWVGRRLLVTRRSGRELGIVEAGQTKPQLVGTLPLRIFGGAWVPAPVPGSLPPGVGV